MLNMICADLFKMWKSPAIKILLGITTLCSVTMAVMAYLIPQGMIDFGMTGIGFMFSDINIINLLGAVSAGIFICGDFDNKAIHDAIACGCTRGTIIVSKTMVFFSAIAFILLPYTIVTVIALSTGFEFSMGSVAVGFLNILTQNSGNAYHVSDLLKLFIVMLTLMIVYAAQLSICVPLAFVLKKPVLVVAIYYVFTILSAQLMGVTSTVVKSIYDSTPYGGNYMFLTIKASTGEIAQAISVSLVFIIIVIAITYTLFRKSEIK